MQIEIQHFFFFFAFQRCTFCFSLRQRHGLRRRGEKNLVAVSGKVLTKVMLILMRLVGVTDAYHIMKLAWLLPPLALNVHQWYSLVFFYDSVVGMSAACGVFSPLRVLDAIRTLYLLSVTWRRRGICLLSLWTAGWPPKSGFFAVFLMRHTTTMPTMQAMRKTPAQYMAIST